MLLTFVAAFGVVAFPGGDANDFAKTLAEATHQNVVVAQSVVEPIRKVTFDPGDLNAMARALRSQAGLAISPGVRLTLNDGLLDPRRIAKVPVGFPEPKWVELGDDAVKDGVVDFETKDSERLDPASLERAHFSKPVKVHWFYARMPVSASVQGMPEVDFLTYVAKAVGATLTIASNEYRLDFDPGEVRTRALKRLGDWPKEWLRHENDDPPGSAQSRLTMLRETLETVGVGDMRKAFEKDDSYVDFRVSRTSRIASGLVDSLKPQLTKDPATGRSALRSPMGPISLPQDIDERRGIEVRLTAQFETKFTFHLASASDKDAVITFTFND